VADRRSDFGDDDSDWLASATRTPVPDGDDDGALTTALYQWAADARIDELSQARSREHSLRQQLAEDATFSGVLVDLAEHAQPVTVSTASTRSHAGHIVAVGVDFIILRDEMASEILIRRAAVTSVRPSSSSHPSLGDRTFTVDRYFTEAISALAEDRQTILIANIGDASPTVGELRSVGQDLITISLADQKTSLVYVPVSSIAEVSLVPS